MVRQYLVTGLRITPSGNIEQVNKIFDEYNTVDLMVSAIRQGITVTNVLLLTREQAIRVAKVIRQRNIECDEEQTNLTNVIYTLAQVNGVTTVKSEWSE